MKLTNATIIVVGDEILIGQVLDTNSTWIAQQLNAVGVAIKEIITVSDTAERINNAIERATIQSDLVLMTGGLGPTKDDITKATIAAFYGDDMVYDEETYHRLVKLMAKYDRVATEAHKAQCFMPSSSILLKNDMGTAPGMLFERENHVLVSMPGVPYEMKFIMDTHVLPYVTERTGDVAIYHKTILTAGEGESIIARSIDHILETLPEYISVAFLPSLGSVRIRLTGKGNNQATLQSEINRFVEQIVTELGDIVYGYDSENLVVAIGNICKTKNIKIGMAESCTGGKLSSIIVNQSGSSAFFEGSVVSYSNTIKEHVLGVRSETLKKYGAVSEQTVKEMVCGATKVLGVDVAVAISGIAGPGGGSAEKPVGTVWIAIGNEKNMFTQQIQATKDRENNILLSSIRALNLLRRYLMDYEA